MTVDTKCFFSNKWSPRQVTEIVCNVLAQTIEWKQIDDDIGSYAYAGIELGGHKRTLHFHTETTVCGFKGRALCIQGTDGNDVLVNNFFSNVLEITEGFLQRQDHVPEFIGSDSQLEEEEFYTAKEQIIEKIFRENNYYQKKV